MTLARSVGKPQEVDNFNTFVGIHDYKWVHGNMVETASRQGSFNLRFVRLLSGAVMTKSQPFVKQVLDILADYLVEHGPSSRYAKHIFQSYGDSLRYPFILAIEYDMKDTYELLGKLYDHHKDRYFTNDVVDEIAFTNSINVLDRILPFFFHHGGLLLGLIERGKYELADHVLIEFRKRGHLYSFSHSSLQEAIDHGNIGKIKYLMKYITPTQSQIDNALQAGAVNIARVLQGQPEIEEVIDE